MAIAARFDVHRAQITFDALDTQAGEITRGRIDRRRRRISPQGIDSAEIIDAVRARQPPMVPVSASLRL